LPRSYAIVNPGRVRSPSALAVTAFAISPRIDQGNSRCMLSSAATARRFYLANGYLETGPAEGRFRTQTGFPMSKALK
jgi:hypothetical protein